MSKAIELIEKYKVDEGTDVPKDAKEVGRGFKDTNKANEFLGFMFGINPTAITGGGAIGSANTFEVKGEIVAWLDKNKTLFLSPKAHKKFLKG